MTFLCVCRLIALCFGCIFINTTYELFFDYHSSAEVSYSSPIAHFVSSMWLHRTFFKKYSIGNKSKTSSYEAISKPNFVSRAITKILFVLLGGNANRFVLIEIHLDCASSLSSILRFFFTAPGFCLGALVALVSWRCI